jgi:biotin synthase
MPDRVDMETLAGSKNPAEIAKLAAAGLAVREKFRGNRPALCALINIRSGACSEDCAYCAQSARHNTGVATYPLISAEAMRDKARELVATGADHICLVASGRGPSEEDLETICQAAVLIKEATGLPVCACVGLVGKEDVKRLKKAGVVRYNHNLETSRNYYPKICTTHGWDERYATARALKDGGMELCCGGIIGMGETDADRLDLAYSLRELEPAVVTFNILIPIPGSALDHLAITDPLEAIKWVAIFRMINPTSALKLAGGREKALRDYQGAALLAGADGMIVGGYLTTSGRSVEVDLKMLADAGLGADRS